MIGRGLRPMLVKERSVGLSWVLLNHPAAE